MRRRLHHIRDWILPIIDFFYPPFQRIFSRQTFRYAASGGGNVVLGFLVYSLSFEYLFHGQVWVVDTYTFTPHSASLFLSFCVTFPIGFFMSKYVVFSDSELRGRVQLFRYFLICQFNLFLNWILLKAGVEFLKIHPLPAQLLTIAVVVVVSYLAQRYFSFRGVPIKD
ncbi:MAG: GtrA family protein [Bacteroidota bacterium]